MGRQAYGQPYDPTLRETEHGSRLYTTWRSVIKCPHCEEWGNFPAFYAWAMQSGYTIGAWLKRFDASKPYIPDNCRWYIPGNGEGNITQEDLDRWNKTVNRIRKHYGMQPLEGTKYGD